MRPVRRWLTRCHRPDGSREAVAVHFAVFSNGADGLPVIVVFTVGRYDPATGAWTEWRLPGDAPQAYAVYVDERDDVWLSDFGANALVRFDPDTETFAIVSLLDPGAAVRQILGRPGEVWGAESGADALVVVRTDCA